MQRFLGRKVAFLRLAIALTGRMEPRSIEPKTAKRLSVVEGAGGMHAWPVAWREHQTFFRALAQQIGQAGLLGFWLVAHRNRLIAPTEHRTGPVMQPSHLF
ncbi:MAG: hypothetical protein AAGN46_01900 [Acidobacteriota bacterium]